MNAEEAPRKAMSCIQNTAPGPPKQIAVDTPIMLPVPTRDAVDTINAWNDDIPVLSEGFSSIILIDSRKCLT